MPPPDPTDPYLTKVYASSNRKTHLAHLLTSVRVTNGNLYSMIEIVCVFTQTFYLKDARGAVVKRDKELLEPGEFFIITSGSVTPTHESPLAARPRGVTTQSGTLRIKSFCKEVRDRDRACVLTGKRVLNPHLNRSWGVFEAGHIFPLALEPDWDAYNFTGSLGALPPRESDHAINSVQNGLLLMRSLHFLFDRYERSINPDDDHKICLFTTEAADYVTTLSLPRQAWLDHGLRPTDAILRWHYRQCVLSYVKV